MNIVFKVNLEKDNIVMSNKTVFLKTTSYR